MDTTAGPGTAERGVDPSPGDNVGRYRIERILGAGGMGVVFAAHDPDLDRRVALKILRSASGRDVTQARARLLREARAMAKLSHPNVITVHEVGTDGSRDFVAMELIDGKNVADWLTERRPAAEVRRVLLAAGGGLAAAHAAGLIHRDFKPHNVLLGRDGRVVVTDFGLARAYEEGAEAAPVVVPAATGLEETLDAPARPAAALSKDASSLSNTLTQTGAMLGTPAYMAPEQFAGSATGPETDQFAFCVALWEGLAGTRPFRGGSLEELRGAVEAGVPGGGGAIPRRFRTVLARGLRRDPAARWPSMAALLAALDRAERRPRRIAAAGFAAVALAAGVAAVVLTRPEPAAQPAACAPAELMTWPVWSPGRADALGRHFASEPEAWRRARRGLDGFTAGWQATWRTTCQAPDEPRFHARVACLTGALDDLAAMSETLAGAPPELLRQADPALLLPAPAGCLDSTRIGYPRPPDDPEVRAKVAAIRRELAVARVWARAGRGDEARARGGKALEEARALDATYPAILAEALEAQGTVLHVLDERAEAERLYEEAATVAERAGHDPVRAVAMVGTLELVAGRSSDGNLIRSLADRASAAIARAGNDPSLRAGVDISLARLAVVEGDLDAAIELVEHARLATEKTPERRRAGVAAQIEAEYRLLRDGPGDAARAEELLERALAAAEQVYGADHSETHGLLAALGGVRWQTGDLAGAHELFARLAPEPAGETPAPRRVRRRGRVVDDRGAPVAGATVIASRLLFGDPMVLVFPDKPGDRDEVVRAVTGADGRFDLEAADGALVVAELGDRRARAALLADDVVLTLREPGRITGVVTLSGGPPPGDDPVIARARVARIGQAGVATGVAFSRFVMVAPRDDAGRWEIPGVPAGSYHAVAVAMTLLGDIHQRFAPVELAPGGTTEVAQPIDLDGVVLDVIIRSDRAGSIPTAEVHVMPGRRRLRRTEELYGAFLGGGRAETGYGVPISDQTRTRAGAALYRDDDIHALIGSVPPGRVTICVIPFGGDIADTGFLARVRGHAEDLEMTCTVVDVPAEPAVQAIVVETPPMKRLE